MGLHKIHIPAKLFISYTDNMPPCPSDWEKISNGCYKFVKDKVTWDTARATCLQLGGDLVIPKSVSECRDLSIYALSFGMEIPWIGLYRYLNRAFVVTVG